MDFQSIKLVNFRNHENTELDLTDSTMWVLRGRNSAGKSTLACDALTYALFGKIKAMEEPNDLRVKKDDIVKRGKDETEVTIEFSQGGDDYILTRTRKLTPTSALETVTMYRSGIQIMDDEKTTKANEWIEKNLYTYDDFTKTTLILQNEMTKMLEMTTGERKDYLEELFGIKDFDRMSELAREKAKSITRKIESDEAVIENNEKDLINIHRLNKEKTELKNELEKAQLAEQEAKEEKKEAEKEKQKILDLKRELKGLQEEIDEIESEIKEGKKEKEGLEEEKDIIKNLLEKEDDLNQKKQQIEKLEEKLEKLKEKESKRKEFAENKRKWTEQIKEKKDDIEKQLKQKTSDLKGFNKEIESLQKEIDDLEEKNKEIDKLKEELASFEQVEAEFNQLQENSDKYSKLDKKFSNLRTELQTKLDNKKAEIEEKKKRINTLPELEASYIQKKESKELISKKEDIVGTIEAEKKKLHEEINELENKISRLDQNISNQKEKITALEKERTKLRELEETAVCPKCKQQLDEEHVKEIILDINEKILDTEEEIKSIKQEKNEVTDTQQKLRRKSEEKDGKIDEIQKEIEEHRKLSDGLNALEKDISEVKKIKAEVKQFEEDGGLQRAFPKLRDKIKKVEEERDRFEVDQDYLEELKNRYDELKTKKERLKNYEAEVKSLDKKKNDLQNKSRRTHEIEKEIKKFTHKLEKEDFAHKARKQVKSLKEKIEKLSKELQEKRSIEKELSELKPEEVRRRLEEIEKKKSHLTKVKSRIENKQEEISKLDSKLQKNVDEIKKDRYDKLDHRLAEAEKDLKTATQITEKKIEARVNAQRDYENHIEIMEEQEKLREEINREQEKIDEKKTKRDHYELLERIFKKIGGRILSRLRSQINLVTSDILGQLGNPQLRGISLNDDYSLSIQTGENEAEVPGFFSGGQRVRIGLAFRLALSQVLADYRGNELDTLIIDEGGFGSLDVDGQQGVIDVFNSLEDKYRRIIIISHIPSIAEKLPGMLLHIKNGNIAKIEA